MSEVVATLTESVYLPRTSGMNRKDARSFQVETARPGRPSLTARVCLEKEIQNPTAQGRSTKIITMIK